MTPGKQAIGAALSVLVVWIASCSSQDDQSSPWHPSTDASAGGGTQDGGTGHDGTAGTVVNPFDGGGESTISDHFNSDGCASNSVSATQTPANMLFLIDRTGSMRCNPPPTMDTAECEKQPQKKDGALPSKWEITRDALKLATDGLKVTLPVPAVGIGFFNSDDFCGYPDAPSVNIQTLTAAHTAAINASLDQVSPWGATPIVGTMMRAFAYLQQNAGQFTGNKFVVLLTDGGETCDKDAKPLVVQKALEATWIGIRTFVLGAPGSESERAFLSQIAFNGGTASNPTCDHSGAAPDQGDCHMDMTLPNTDFAVELAKNLTAISIETLSCEFDVPQPADGDVLDPSKVNVNYTPGTGGNPVQLPKNDKYACTDPQNNGWQYSADNTKIELCGSACTKVKDDPGAKVSIVLGCQTEEVTK